MAGAGEGAGAGVGSAFVQAAARTARTSSLGIPLNMHAGDPRAHLDRDGTGAPGWCLTTVRTTCLWAASVVALAMPARADDLPTIDSVFPPTIRVNDPGSTCSIERIAVEVHARAVSWVTIEVKVPRFGRGIMPVDLPVGSRIVGMAMITPDERTWSAALPKVAAVEAFDREPDGALLTWSGSTAEHDHLSIVVAESARIELAVELPPLVVLAIDPDRQAITRIEATVAGHDRRQWTKQRTPVVLDLRGIEAHVAIDPYPHVTEHIALVAGAPERVDRPFESRSSRRVWSGDKMMIRRRMKLSRERITYCYEHVAQWRYRPELDGTVMLRFLIGTSGKIETAVATSTFPAEINTCLENVIKEWEFPLLDSAVQVNYPLDFRTADY